MAARKTRAPKRKAKIERDELLGSSARIEVAPDDPTRDTVHESVQEFIEQAMRRFAMASDAEDYNRAQGLLDCQMVDGEAQWDDVVVQQRQDERRPCLTINRFQSMISYVANEERQMRVGVQVHPVGGGADKDGAQIRQGLIRSIENESHAETIYDQAFERMLEKGWSWFRVVSEYESETSFNQVLRLVGFVNDFCVYTDPNAQDPTRRDMEWTFVIEDIPIGEYFSIYRDSKIRAESLSEFESIGDSAPAWLTSQYVRVAEYYYVDYEPGQLIQLVDGSGRWKDELEERDGIYFDTKTKEPVPVAMDDDGEPIERMSRRRKVKWCKINAVEILEGEKDKESGEITKGIDLKATWIPLIMVSGRERNINGQRRLSGMVRNNRDAQRMYNYWVSAFTEMIALAPKAPYIAAAGQIEKYKSIWDLANQKNFPYLPYDPVTKDMQPVPAPQRQFVEPPVQAIIMAIRQADNDLKAGFNIYDSALGNRGPQESGKAMLIGKTQSESANMNWIDNLSRSIQHGGEVMLDLIPTRYDAARVVSIVRPDNERQEVQINQLFRDPKTGDQKLIDMARGKYSTTVTAGLTNVTKRLEAQERMFSLLEARPELAPIILDLVLEETDWPGADRIADRLYRALPPDLKDRQDGDQPQIPPEVQQQIEQVMQQFQELQAAYEEAQKVIEGKQVESQSKEKIAQLQASTQKQIATIKTSTELAIAKLQLQLKGGVEVMKDRREREKAKQQPKAKKAS